MRTNRLGLFLNLDLRLFDSTNINIRQLSMVKVLKGLAILLLLLVVYLTGGYLGLYGELEESGPVTKQTNNFQLKQDNNIVVEGSTAEITKQILFGDLHVHTTFSIDAFQGSLALMGGEGSHPPADACDFARFCSALDFYSINDHAESLTPSHWDQTKDSIQQCNAVSADESNPDLVAFLGWEWTHAGTTPENHYGHKNVVLKDYKGDNLPTRPVYAIQPLKVERAASAAQRIVMPLLEPADRQRTYDFFKLTDTVGAVPECAEGVHVKDLPSNCREGAATPKELFTKLDQWGIESMVIPHGNSWGIYTPPGTRWDKQLKNDNQDGDRQFLFEVFSGHGSAEEYRDWEAVAYDKEGNASCPPPSENYLPSCWKAGDIIKKRCEAEGIELSECEIRATQARQFYAENGIAGHNAAPGTTLEEWLDSGQCTDCIQPAFNYRPGGSAQYALSVTEFDEEGNKERFRFGMIGSSDNHQARPGTGYKELGRFGNTETAGVQHGAYRPLIYGTKKPLAEPKGGELLKLPPVKRYEHERSSSFFYTGGLVAVHSEGRDRQSIWDALQRKEVYATSGERMMLWFDMVNDDGQAIHPMGSEVAYQEVPKFTVTAMGAFKQKPGCPADTIIDFGKANIEKICRDECYNPSDERKIIERIEVVRIEPQMFPDEPIISPEGDSRIETVWKTFDCPENATTCTINFSDEEFVNEQRDVVYYARAIQEAAPTINGGNLRCEFDEQGNCIKVDPCYSDDRSGKSDQCLTDTVARAWSSPIFVDYKK